MFATPNQSKNVNMAAYNVFTSNANNADMAMPAPVPAGAIPVSTPRAPTTMHSYDPSTPGHMQNKFAGFNSWSSSDSMSTCDGNGDWNMGGVQRNSWDNKNNSFNSFSSFNSQPEDTTGKYWDDNYGWRRYPQAPTTGGANMKWEKKKDGQVETNYNVSKYNKFVNNVNVDVTKPMNIDSDDVKGDGSVFYTRVCEINFWAKNARDAVQQEDTLALIRGMCQNSVNVTVKGQLFEGKGQAPRGCYPLFIECSGTDGQMCENAVKHIEEIADYIMMQN